MPPSVYVPYISSISGACSIAYKKYLITSKSYSIFYSLKILNLRAIDKFHVFVIDFQRFDTNVKF